MNSYEQSRMFELTANRAVLEILRQHGTSGLFVSTDDVEAVIMISKHPEWQARKGIDEKFFGLRFEDQRRYLQKHIGDYMYDEEGVVRSLEIKSERENKYGNFFIETWSNLSRYTVGWAYSLNADGLLYYFAKEKALYAINYESLKEWCFKWGRIYDYPEKEQKIHDQPNDTWGRCVPIDVIEKEIGFRKFS